MICLICGATFVLGICCDDLINDLEEVSDVPLVQTTLVSVLPSRASVAWVGVRPDLLSRKASRRAPFRPRWLGGAYSAVRRWRGRR